jgi:hypothetical protein
VPGLVPGDRGRDLACLSCAQWAAGTTLSGNHVRLGLPPKAARTVGPLEGVDAPMNQSREAHLAARPLHSPEGG